MQTTTNLGLKKPEGTDIVNIDDFNYNSDAIDVEIKSLNDNKQDKVAGKGLSTNDYTTTEKNKLAGIATGANNYVHPTGDGSLHVPTTGTTSSGKVLKAGATAGSFSWGTLAKTDVGLGSVDNTADSAKNVLSATKLATTRTISLTGDVTGSVSFDGSANASITATVADDSHNHVISNIDNLQTSIIPYAVTTGSANTYVVSTTPVLPSLAAGVAISIKIHAENTGASTLNWDSKGAKSILKANGSALNAGNLKLNGVYTLRYDGTAFILQGEGVDGTELINSVNSILAM